MPILAMLYYLQIGVSHTNKVLKCCSTCSTSANLFLVLHDGDDGVISNPMTAECTGTAPEEEYICLGGFLCGWPAGVEFAAGLCERPGTRHKHLKTFLFAVS